jgi:hypothetical protein
MISRFQWKSCFLSADPTTHHQWDLAGSAWPPRLQRPARSPGRRLRYRPLDRRSLAPRKWLGRDSGSTLGCTLSPPDRVCCPQPPSGRQGSDPGAEAVSSGIQHRERVGNGHRLLRHWDGAHPQRHQSRACLVGPCGDTLDSDAMLCPEIF